MQINQLYERVTNQIIAELESGNVPMWLKPWKSGKRGGIMPTNHATGRNYNGVNILLLWSEREEKCYPTPEWLTFKQALDKGGNVKKGEKSTNIVFAKQLTVKEDEETKIIPMMKVYNVFNVSQCEGLSVNAPPPELPEHGRFARAEHFIDATKAEIRFGENMAAYIPSKDWVIMPPRGAFKDAPSLYATMLHELGHWSGAEKRLNRDLKHRFGTHAYAAEELVAELCSAFLCAHLDIQGELRHAGYIENWITLLKEDARAIFTAASKASQAADYLRAFSETTEPLT